MVAQLLLRQEQHFDHKDVFELNCLAFGQENEAKLVAALRNNSETFVPELSIVASQNNKVIGHILFTRIVVQNNNGTTHYSLALAPMAVIPELQKQGIGAQLIKHGLKVAKVLGYGSVIVLGHEHYYPKFGFQPAANWGIKAPFEVPTECFMAIELEKDALKNISGTVRYPSEFERV